MARNFNELREKMSPERRARNAREVQRMVEELRLRQIRDAREMTQQQLAEVLGVAQSDVSKIERRADMYVSTLASYLKAMDGELTIQVTFPDGKVIKISQFEDAA